MAYEFLERLYGAPKEGEQPKAMTFAELTAAIEADKNMKLVDLSAGGYVEQHAFDAQKTELEGVRSQLAAQRRTHAEDMLLSGYKFTSKAARNGVAAELKAQQFQLSDSGELAGAAEWLKGLTKQEDYKGAFVVEAPPEEAPISGPRFSASTSNQPTTPKGNPFGNMGFNFVNPPKK